MIIERLSQEHRNIKKLLAILERRIATGTACAAGRKSSCAIFRQASSWSKQNPLHLRPLEEMLKIAGN
jgi:hypothetical protein